MPSGDVCRSAGSDRWAPGSDLALLPDASNVPDLSRYTNSVGDIVDIVVQPGDVASRTGRRVSGPMFNRLSRVR